MPNPQVGDFARSPTRSEMVGKKRSRVRDRASTIPRCEVGNSGVTSFLLHRQQRGRQGFKSSEAVGTQKMRLALSGSDAAAFGSEGGSRHDRSSAIQ